MLACLCICLLPVFAFLWYQLSSDESREAFPESRLCQGDHWADFNADQLAELYHDSGIIQFLTDGCKGHPAA